MLILLMKNKLCTFHRINQIISNIKFFLYIYGGKNNWNILTKVDWFIIPGVVLSFSFALVLLVQCREYTKLLQAWKHRHHFINHFKFHKWKVTLYPKNLSGKANAAVVMNNSKQSLQPQYDGADFMVVTSVNTVRKQIN